MGGQPHVDVGLARSASRGVEAVENWNTGLPDINRATARRGHTLSASVGLMRAGEVLAGRYELRGVLGRGGMAEVRDGWDLRLHRSVAIKLLHPVIAAPANRLRFEAEARAAATLTSPHIVVVHDSGEHNGTPYIVMERLPGASLADEIAKGPLPQPVVRKVLGDVLAALAVAHDAGILHRDIKPDNILFSSTGEAKVSDFGIAKTAEAAYTMTGQIIGTMAYLSPERLAGRPATVADDLYAVGVVGYEALTGRKPFLQQEVPALAHAILTEQPPPVRVLRPDTEPTLSAVIERAMARDPARWFSNAHQMRAALAGANPVTVSARPPTRMLTVPLPPSAYAPMVTAVAQPTRRGKLVAAAAVLAALILAVIILALDGPFTSPPSAPATTTAPTPATTSALATPSTTTFTPAPPPPHRPGKKNGQADEGD